MAPLVGLFWELCLLRKGPQDVPAAEVLLKLCATVYLLINVVTLTFGVARLGVLVALCLALFELVLLSAFTYVLLSFAGLTARLRQTLTALFGAGALLGVIALPLSLWLRRMFEAEADSGLTFPALLTLLLLLWSLAINGHIISAALARPKTVGVLYALGYFFGSWLLADALLALLVRV